MVLEYSSLFHFGWFFYLSSQCVLKKLTPLSIFLFGPVSSPVKSISPYFFYLSLNSHLFLYHLSVFSSFSLSSHPCFFYITKKDIITTFILICCMVLEYSSLFHFSLFYYLSNQYPFKNIICLINVLKKLTLLSVFCLDLYPLQLSLSPSFFLSLQ